MKIKKIKTIKKKKMMKKMMMKKNNALGEVSHTEQSQPQESKHGVSGFRPKLPPQQP